jgi:hypothetical protein
MNALYNNRIYNVVDVAGDITLDADGVEAFDVPFHDSGLIVEPTDQEVANASNLAEWYGVDVARARQLRRMLIGEISVSEWQASKERN